jgi:hypothetical protein
MKLQTKETTGTTLLVLASDDDLSLPDGFEYERPKLEQFRYSSVLGDGVSRCDIGTGGDDECVVVQPGGSDDL